MYRNPNLPSLLYPAGFWFTLLTASLTSTDLMAQTTPVAGDRAPSPALAQQAPPPFTPPRTVQPPSRQQTPLPEIKPAVPVQPEVPPLNIEKPQPAVPSEKLPDVPPTVFVTQFRVEEPQVFSQPEIDEVTKSFLKKDLTFAELQAAADAINQHYLKKGYITSGAYVPAMNCKDPDGKTIVPCVITKDGVVPVRVVTDQVKPHGIQVRFVQKKKDAKTEFEPAKRHRLRADYIRSRLAIATKNPLNQNRLLEALQLLQINPLIANIRANLYPSTTPGESFLDVDVEEARSFQASLLLDNGSPPSIGSFRRQIQINERNLTGRGDGLVLTYANTDGSNAGFFSYTLPVNPRDGTLSLNFGIGSSRVVEQPFDILDIRSPSRYIELTFRQPIILTPNRQLALGLTLGHQYNKSTLVDGEIPFPVPGSDFEGKTRSTPLRFFQEWRQNGDAYVLSLRSQFSFGLPLGATDNEAPPDGRFFSWQGQAQWVQALAADRDFLLIVRGNIQLADRALIPIEQFGLGGPLNVRGYRQDAILADSGVFGSAEVRIPVLRIPEIGGLLQLTPFVDVGTAWNRSGFDNPDPQTLASVGLGLRLQLREYLEARFEWGIPLVSIANTRDTWQERGLYFSLIFTPF